MNQKEYEAIRAAEIELAALQRVAKAARKAMPDLTNGYNTIVDLYRGGQRGAEDIDNVAARHDELETALYELKQAKKDSR